MSYRKDGSSHYNGVSMEETIISFITEAYKNNKDVLEFYDELLKKQCKIGKIVCEHKGGTRTKKDAIIKCGDSQELIYTLSIKRKETAKEKPNGTFDIVHKSLKKFNKEYDVFNNKDVEEFYAELKAKKPFIKTDKDVEELKPEFLSMCSSLIETGKSFADKVMDLALREFYKTDFIVIGAVKKENDNKNLSSIYVERENKILFFEQVKLEGNSFYFDADDAEGKASRRIMVKTKNGEVYQTPYRLRLGLNNGLSPFFGLAKSKHSSLSLKIQVDDVAYLLKQMRKIEVNQKVS